MEPNRISSSHTYRLGEDLAKGLRPPVRPSSVAVLIRTYPPTPTTVQAGDLFKVRLGAVTGDSDYFLLSEERRLELRLPLEALIPVVTRSRHLTSASISRQEWNKIRDAGDRAYLFRPSLRRIIDLPSVNAYLQLPLVRGGCNKTAGWVKKRDPWYQVNVPNHPHGFMSGASSNGPWIALNAMRDLVATNTLYVIQFEKTITGKDATAACALSLLTTFGRCQTTANTRTYPGGLKKLEPSGISNVMLPVKQRVDGAFEIYDQATKALLFGNAKLASELADDWFATK